MAEVDDTQPPPELLAGGAEHAMSMEVGPDMTDDTPSEGRINGPIPTRGLEKRAIPEKRTPADPKYGQAYESIEIRIKPTDIEDRSTRGSTSIENIVPSEGTDASIGFEGMMHDITELIEVMPLENAVEETLPAPPTMPNPFARNGTVPASAVPYDPSERPTSRWRCRWKLFSPHDEDDRGFTDTLSAYVRRDPFVERVDFRNPYIKALTNTREELSRSWDLFSESSAASRLATERHSGLASMHIVEVDNVISEASRLTCMPEPCRETCRENSLAHQEMCEVQIMQHKARHAGVSLDYSRRPGERIGPSPTPARCEDIMIEAGAHPPGDNEELLFNPSLGSGLKYAREEV